VERFDVPGNPAILIGTGDLLGEGVDMQHAEVGINLATGSVNKQLIQRIGRVLRNPDGDKHAEFVNLVGIPVKRDAQVPSEDGKSLLEDAGKFVTFGRSFDNNPVFAAGDDIDTNLSRLLKGGYKQIASLDQDGVYNWPNQSEADILRTLLEAIQEHIETGGAQAVLDVWSPDEQNRRVSPEQADSGDDLEEVPSQITLQIVTKDGSPVSGAFVSLSGNDFTTYGRTSDDGEIMFSDVNGECTAGIYKPDIGVRSLEIRESDQPVHRTVSLISGGLS
jgi:hypothetical protein